jgi:hypothetical protein
MFQTVQFPATISNLTSSLTDVNAYYFPLTVVGKTMTVFIDMDPTVLTVGL